MSVNATSSETRIENAIVSPNEFMKRPTMPPMNATGRNTATSESVVAVTASADTGSGAGPASTQRTARQATAAPSDGYHVATRLGGSSRFYRRPIRDLADLKKIFSAPRMQQDVKTVLDEAGLSSLSSEVAQSVKSCDY